MSQNSGNGLVRRHLNTIGIKLDIVSRDYGLDVSMEETSVCILDEAGETVFTGKVDSTPEAIAALVRKRALGVVRVVLETGPLSTWHWHKLRALGIPVVCLEKVTGTFIEFFRKSDRHFYCGGATDFLDTGATGANGNYGGPCPPKGDKPHHYNFTLYALAVDDVQKAGGIPKTGTSALYSFILNKGLGSKLLGTASFTAVYGR